MFQQVQQDTRIAAAIAAADKKQMKIEIPNENSHVVNDFKADNPTDSPRDASESICSNDESPAEGSVEGTTAASCSPTSSTSSTGSSHKFPASILWVSAQNDL